MTVERETYVKIAVYLKVKTDKAALVVYDDDDEQWIARSIMSWRGDNNVDKTAKGQHMELEIPVWKAQQLGWN